MHQSKEGPAWFFGMKAHIGVDADSGLVHTVRCASGNVNDVVEANSLLRGQETDVFADAGYQGAQSTARRQRRCRGMWPCAPGPEIKLLDKADPMDVLTDQVERIKPSIRAKVGDRSASSSASSAIRR